MIFSGNSLGTPRDYYSTMAPAWVAFQTLRQLSADIVELEASTSAATLRLRWSLAGRHPELQWTVTAAKDGHVVVGYQAVDPVSYADVEEVLCGSKQHARRVSDIEFLGAWELFAPMTLAQHSVLGTTLTAGLFVPSEVLEFVHERELGALRQPFGMTLRNEERLIQPAATAPQVGDDSFLTAGESKGFAFGLYLQPGSVEGAFEELSRSESVVSCVIELLAAGSGRWR